MPIYVVTPKTGRIQAAARSSPRIVIVTDAKSASDLPEQVRLAGDLISTEDLGTMRGEPVTESADGAIAWVHGDRLILGDAGDLRRAFFGGVPKVTFVPVHLPCLEEADLIGLQPRLIGAKAEREDVSTEVRFAGVRSPSELARTTWKQSGKHWAQLHLALLREAQPGEGIEPLRKLWQTRGVSPALAALVLRNLIVILLRQKQMEKTDELLRTGLDHYPGYAELHFLYALLWVHRRKPKDALSELDLAMKSTGRGFVGSGGENSYRASWLLGTICEEMSDQERAILRFLPGVHQRPAFAPSVAGILRQRVSRHRAGQLHPALCELVRREPHYLKAVFDFYLRHRSLETPRRLLRTLPLAEKIREELQRELAHVEAIFRPASICGSCKPGIILEGPILLHSAHARINRALACGLLTDERFDAAIEPTGYGKIPTRSLAEGPLLAEGLRRHPGRLDLTIRHEWPPDFRRPMAGKLACIVPWEHRAVARAWVREIEKSVDELWVPSQFVADAFTAGGVNCERIQVIPNGVSTEVFRPEGARWRPTGCGSCVFLFVGGTIRRKGVDLLLRAYADAFGPGDDVTLLIKDTGSTSFYADNNLIPLIQWMVRNAKAAPVGLLTEEMDDARLASLYRGCDALVLPFRGEGFGMPLAEAMACGKPVVTTAAGPALEFCPEEATYFVKAREVTVSDPPPPLGTFSCEWTWFEPDLCELAQAMRDVYENRSEAARKGEMAGIHAARELSWQVILPKYKQRIAELTGMTVTAASPQLAEARK